VTTQTVQAVGTTTMPRVNLMPPEIAEAARFRQVQMGLAGAVAAAVAIAGFLYYHEHQGVAAAKQQLQTAQQQNSALQQKLNSLSPVQQTFDAVQAREAMLSTAMGSEVRWSFILNDLSFRMPSNVWLTSMQVGQAQGAAAAAPVTSSLPGTATTPVAVPIASISFSGVGFRHDDVAAWLDAMAKEKSFSDPIFTNSAESTIGARKVVTFGSQVTVTSLALSGRYTMPAASATGATTQ
jgi:Tfp pilus assembly protein PilN